jgi:hypothetical protein
LARLLDISNRGPSTISSSEGAPRSSGSGRISPKLGCGPPKSTPTPSDAQYPHQIISIFDFLFRVVHATRPNHCPSYIEQLRSIRIHLSSQWVQPLIPSYPLGAALGWFDKLFSVLIQLCKIMLLPTKLVRHWSASHNLELY